MPCQLESQVHSTNTLIDEVGLVEMEVGLDQLTWGDADLQRELRRLKDNSLKIPNLKYIFKIALLRVIPTLTHYSDIVSDISSGRICGIYVLTYYLTFFSEILFDILSGILSGIYSDILSGIYYILILPCHEFGLGPGSSFICVDQCQWLEYPPNVGFTCLHPMIAITIDTPKWPGPEFESRS